VREGRGIDSCEDEGGKQQMDRIGIGFAAISVMSYNDIEYTQFRRPVCQISPTRRVLKQKPSLLRTSISFLCL